MEYWDIRLHHCSLRAEGTFSRELLPPSLASLPVQILPALMRAVCVERCRAQALQVSTYVSTAGEQQRVARARVPTLDIGNGLAEDILLGL